MTSPGKKTRILIVEDEPDIAGLMKHALERGGNLEVEIVGTGAEALQAVMEEPPGLILLGERRRPKSPCRSWLLVAALFRPAQS